MKLLSTAYNSNLPIIDCANLSKPVWTGVYVVSGSILLLIIAIFRMKNIQPGLLYVLLFCSLAIGGFLVYKNIKNSTLYKAFEQNGLKKKATLVHKLVDEAVDSDGADKYYIFYQFHPDFIMRKQIIIGNVHTGNQMRQYFDQFQIGETLEILHHPNDFRVNVPLLPAYKNYRVF
jgi:hypothetical protein